MWAILGHAQLLDAQTASTGAGSVNTAPSHTRLTCLRAAASASLKRRRGSLQSGARLSASEQRRGGVDDPSKVFDGRRCDCLHARQPLGNQSQAPFIALTECVATSNTLLD